MRNTRPNRSIRWILATAIAGPVMGLMSFPAEAQFRQNQDGGARDANNRVGSGGAHRSSPKYGSGVTPDMIIYGNVTNSKYFRGPVGSGDPRAFRGTTADTASDRFIRDSTGGYDRAYGAQQFNTQAYYGESRGVAAPIGYVPTKTSQVYTNSPYQMNNTLSSSASLGAISLGDGFVPRLGSSLNTLPTPINAIPQAGLVMSPLGGIRQLGFGDEAIGGNDIYTIRNGAVQGGLPTDRFRTDGAMIDRIRGEISEPADNAPAGPEGAQPLGKPLESPASGEIRTPTLGGGSSLGQPISGSLGTGQGFRRQLVTAAQQSEQVSELQKRLAAQNGARPLTGMEIQRDIAGANARKPQPGTPGAPNAPVVPPGAVPPGVVRPAPAVDPLTIKSLATGIKAKSLADVLTKAEVLMKEGKFAEALDQYDLAERAAPNNGLITLGRANAELGASSYRSAETHLRQAIGGEPALLLAKYDLGGMIGADRLAILTRDLRDLAANEPRESTASFLLAYINYNTGHEAEAAGHLTEVEKRVGAADPVVAKMRELWTLPGGAGLNK